jgi:hypothetical protein
VTGERSGVSRLGALLGIDDLAANPLSGEADLFDDVYLRLAVVESGKDLSDQFVMRRFGRFGAALVCGGEAAKALLTVLFHWLMFAHVTRHQGMAVSHGLSIAKPYGH